MLDHPDALPLSMTPHQPDLFAPSPARERPTHRPDRHERSTLEAISKALADEHGPLPSLRPKGDPLKRLIGALLAQRSKTPDRKQAEQQLWQRFASPEALLEAELAAIEEAIALVTFPETKAPRIRQLLTDILDERGDLDLGFLDELDLQEAMQWLQRFRGIGKKTAAYLMLFTFNKPVLPVDTHMHRFAKRFGLIPESCSADKAHDILAELMPDDAEAIADFVRLVKRHGQTTCRWRSPHCRRCPLREDCPGSEG